MQKNLRQAAGSSAGQTAPFQHARLTDAADAADTGNHQQRQHAAENHAPAAMPTIIPPKAGPSAGPRTMTRVAIPRWWRCFERHPQDDDVHQRDRDTAADALQDSADDQHGEAWRPKPEQRADGEKCPGGDEKGFHLKAFGQPG